MSLLRFALLLAASLCVAPAVSQQAAPSPSADFITGVPRDPSDPWAIGYGGRLYDSWWLVLGKPEPDTNNPSYPATGAATGADTWACTACHGWDYKGVAGFNGKGPVFDPTEAFTGIKGIEDAEGMDPAKIAALLRAPPHNYTPAMIRDDALLRLALFVSAGLYDTGPYIDLNTRKVSGNVDRGRAIFQTVCASCHGLDGKQMNFGTAADPEYVGTVANQEPAVALHKLMNGIIDIPDDLRNQAPFGGAASAGLGMYPAAMESWRALGLPFAVDALAYAQTLPIK
jgi:mono/diheme cytochrome c family protein